MYEQAEAWVKRRMAEGKVKSGLIDKQTLILDLKAYKLVDQFLFHTVESLSYLKFLEVKEIKL